MFWRSEIACALTATVAHCRTHFRLSSPRKDKSTITLKFKERLSKRIIAFLKWCYLILDRYEVRYKVQVLNGGPGNPIDPGCSNVPGAQYCRLLMLDALYVHARFTVLFLVECWCCTRVPFKTTTVFSNCMLTQARGTGKQ